MIYPLTLLRADLNHFLYVTLEGFFFFSKKAICVHGGRDGIFRKSPHLPLILYSLIFLHQLLSSVTVTHVTHLNLPIRLMFKYSHELSDSIFTSHSTHQKWEKKSSLSVPSVFYLPT